MSDDLSPEERLRKARVKLSLENPFFSYLAMGLKLRKFPQKEINYCENVLNSNPTLAVDIQGNLYYHDDFVNKLSYDELVMVLSHECLHLVFAHGLRGKGRREKSPQIYNIAVDIQVNGILQKNNFEFGSLREGSIIPDNDGTFTFGKVKVLDCLEKTVEEIYDEIYQQAKNNNMLEEVEGEGQEKGFDQHFKDEGKGMSKEKKDSLEKNLKKQVAEAHAKSELAGKIPQGVERLIDELLYPKINWRELLYNYISNSLVTDFSWNRPNRRMLNQGVYLPSPKRENLDLTAVIDLSGSISQEDITEFISEMVGISKSFEAVNLKIITHQTEIDEVFELTNTNEDEILDLKLSGGGGTSHKEVWEYLENEKNKIVVLLTDGESDIEESDEPDCPTMWLITKDGNKEMPFGEVIQL